LYLALSALAGGLVAALLGWRKSGEVWEPLKFLGSVLRSLGAAVTVAIGYTVSPDIAGSLGIMAAFLAGAGVDVLGNRLAGSIVAGQPGNNSPPSQDS